MKAIINTIEFKRIIKAFKPFTRLDSEKMQYIAIYADKETQEIRFEALDGHRIAVEYLAGTVDESFKAYIKPFTIWQTKDGYTEIELLDNKAVVSIGDYSVRFTQPVGDWYETEKMISGFEEEKTLSRVGVNANSLMDALKNIKTGISGRPLVIIECRGKKSPIIIRDEKDKRNIRLVLPMTYRDAEVDT